MFPIAYNLIILFCSIFNKVIRLTFGRICFVIKVISKIRVVDFDKNIYIKSKTKSYIVKFGGGKMKINVR